MTQEPRWVTKGRTYIGTEEIPGPKTHANIKRWLKLTAASWTDDETPWCATYVGGILEECGIRSARTAWARGYLDWGIKLVTPVLGCIAVFSRGVSSGHIGFFLGFTKNGDIIILEGNSNANGSPGIVRIGVQPRGRLLGYRWPASEPYSSALPRQPALDKPKTQQTPQRFVPEEVSPEARPINPSMVTSPTGGLLTTGAVAGTVEAVRQGNEIASEVAQAKENASNLGLLDIIWAHPGVILGLVVAVACAFMWWQHRRYKQALSEAQSGLL